MGNPFRPTSVLVFGVSLLLTLGTVAAANPPQPVSGDFNGDGILDALFQPADSTQSAQIMLGDASGQLTIPAQTLTPGYLGLSWGQDQSNIITGDFTGNGRDDILVQPLAPGGTTAVLLAGPDGRFSVINQQFTGSYLGLDWSAASHHILVGGFTGSGRQDVLLQTAMPGGMNLIAEPNAQGVFDTTGQSWPDGYLGLLWSAQEVTLYTGDFTGNGQSDLLVQVNDPTSNTQVPAYALLLSDGNGEFTQINQSWGTNAFGADWSPATHTLLIEDVTGSGVDDIVLMAKDPNGTNYLFLGNQTGSFSKPDLTWAGTESAQAMWANKMAAEQSIVVSGNTAQSPASKSTTQTTAQPRAMTAQATQTPNAVGTMGGQSGVDGGAATYHIPIVVPPGRAGMQPSLALDYSSRGGNGDLGMSWSLSGLSAITRCPATYAQDGYTQGVTYTTTDRLCFDGQHLIAVSGSYGQSGSVYRTELDSQVRVTLNGNGLNASSSYFEVDHQDGRRSFYGTTGACTNTLFTAAGAPAPLVWALCQTTDLAGNNVVYNYGAYGSGEYHLSSIVYTGISNGVSITSTGNREVDFSYATRSDPRSVYLAGGLTRQTMLLTQITTRVAGNVVRQYSLNYSPSNATGRSLLHSVQECGYAPGSSSLTCLPPDTFTWQDQPLNFGSPQLLTLPTVVGTEAGGDSGTVSIATYVSIDKDFDGDGQRELRYVNPYAAAEGVFWVNNPTNYIDETKFFSTNFRGDDEDFLNNGLADPIGDSGGQMAVAWCQSQPTCTSASDYTTTLTGISYVNASLATGQFAGDGLPDVVADEFIPGTSNHEIYLYPNITTTNGAPTFNTTGVQLAPLPVYSCSGGTSDEFFSPIGDLDGNGIPDLLITANCPNIGRPIAIAFIHNVSGTPGGTTATVQSLSTLGITLDFSQPQIYYFADINGDGLKDFVFVSNNGNPSASLTWHYQINEGGTFGPVVDTGVVAGNDNIANGMLTNFGTIQVGDFTGDGKDELLVPVSRVSTYCVILKVMEEGVWQDETYCGDTMIQKAGAGDDHSVYQFQVLKFVEQPNGSYVPTWVSNGGTPVTVNAEANTVEVGDLYGTGLTDVFMLSSRWFTNGLFNDSSVCSSNTPPCAPVLAEGYYTMSPQNGAPDLMTGATDGLGAQAAWQYDSLTDLKNSGAYTVDRPCSSAPNTMGQLPEYYCFTSSMWVVKSYSVSNDAGGTNNYTYGYNDAVYENRGRGFQGFRQITVTDQAAGTITTNTYNQAFPLSGTLQESKTYQVSGNVLLSDTHETWQQASPTGCLASPKVYWPELTQSQVTKYGTSSETISTTTTNYTYDGYGNTTQIAASTSDSTGTYGTTTSYAWINTTPDCSDWWLDNFDKKTVQSTVSYNKPILSQQPASITRTANYTYTSLRKVQEEQADVGSGFEKDTTYGYDSYGNVTNVTLSSPLGQPGSGTLSGEQGFASRASSSDYSGTGGYLADSITNAAGQTTQINPDPGTGLPLSVTDPNGVVITYGYDAFGRKTSEQVAAPTSLPATQISYTAPASVCTGTATGAAYSVTTSRTGYPNQTACYDLLGRVLRTVTDGFTAGQPSYQDTQYDALGRVIKTSEPYFSGATVAWNSTSYDVLNRPTQKTDAEGVTTSYAYNGLTTTITTTPAASGSGASSRADQEIRNALGKLLSVENGVGSGATTDALTQYRYDAEGNPVLIQDAASHQILATYNLLGQKTSVSDPDMGNWSYVYDVAGDLLQQTDAKNQVIGQRYDNLGRMTSRTQPEGTTVWCYDGVTLSSTGVCTGGSAAPDIGKLTAVAQYDGYQKTYSYDGDGRVINVAEQINGTTYNTSTGYDSDGRVSTVSYPAGVTAAPPVADAGAPQTVWPNTTVTLNGGGSSDPNGLTLHYQWTQTSGPAVTLSGANTANPTFTSGPPGSSYSFQLTVNDGLGTAVATTTVTVATAPGSPTGLSVTPSPSTNGSYTLSWSPPSSGIVTSYYVYESLNGGGYSETGTTGGSVTSYSFSGRGITSANDTYSYYVSACNPSGCASSGTASVVVAYPPGVPGSVSVSPTTSTTGSYTVSWAASSGVVSSYQITESVNGGSYSVAASGINGTATSYAFSGKGSLTSNNTYAYEVAACNYTATNCGNYSASASVLVTLPPTAPSSISLPSQSNWDSSFTVTYGTVTGVSPTYYVDLGEYDQETGQYEWIDGHCVSTSTSCTFTAGQVALGTYYARVYACNQTACGPATQAGNTINVWKLTPPGAPTLSAPSTVTSDSVPLSWSAPSTATSYQLYASYEKSGSFGSYTERYSGSATSYTDSFTALVQAVHYYVVACNQAGCSGSSNVVTVTVQLQGGCKTCSPTNGSQTATPSAGTTSPPPASSSAAPTGAGPLVFSPPPLPVGATVPVAMAATPILQKQNIIPAAISVLPTLGTPYPAAVSSVAAVAPSGTSPITLHSSPPAIAIASSAAPGTRRAAISKPLLPLVAEGGGEGDLNSPAARSTQYAAPGTLLAVSTQHASRLTLHDVQGSTSAAGAGSAGAAASPSSWHYGLPEYLADADMRLEPASSTTTQVGLTVLYTYTSTGYLQQLSNAVYPSQVFWTANSEDAFGQIASETYGGGVISSTIAHNDPLGRITGISSSGGSSTLQGWTYHWDALGNLTSRADNSSSGNVSESFGYDVLSRLTSAQVTNSSGAQPAVSYSYDALGDITSKSDTGSYTYGSGAHPHAVTSISGPAGGTYSYDADGNMVNRNGTAIAWNSDNQPTSITQSSSNSSSFSYAPDKHRYYQSAEINGVAETTVYAGAFEAVTTGGTTTYRYHLSADGREVAEVNLSNSGSTVNETVSYILSDHLGSVDVVTNASGGVVADMSFGVFGNRREPGTWLPPVGPTETQAAHSADRYGFTHQEMLDNVGIIHFGGRIYDPALGRFLSVDPVFEFPTNSQSLNPYSYVLNNPLSMTDPTGYSATDGSICTGPGGSSRGCVGQDVHDLKQGQLNGLIDKAVALTNLYVGPKAGLALGNYLQKLYGGNGQQNEKQDPATTQQRPQEHTNIGGPSNESLVRAAADASSCSYGPSSCTLLSGMAAAGASWYHQNGLNQSVFQDEQSGFSASAYLYGKFTLIAFRGTNGIFDFKGEIVDARQAFGLETIQYAEAYNLARDVSESIPNGVIFTGHSLGGGLATVAALESRDSAITFNAAGISSGTLRLYGLNANEADRRIQAYYVIGDPLTTFQSFTPLPGAFGTPHLLMPTYSDQLKAEINPFYLHTMQAVQDALAGGN